MNGTFTRMSQYWAMPFATKFTSSARTSGFTFRRSCAHCWANCWRIRVSSMTSSGAFSSISFWTTDPGPAHARDAARLDRRGAQPRARLVQLALRVGVEHALDELAVLLRVPDVDFLHATARPELRYRAHA